MSLNVFTSSMFAEDNPQKRKKNQQKKISSSSKKSAGVDLQCFVIDPRAGNRGCTKPEDNV